MEVNDRLRLPRHSSNRGLSPAKKGAAAQHPSPYRLSWEIAGERPKPSARDRRIRSPLLLPGIVLLTLSLLVGCVSTGGARTGAAADRQSAVAYRPRIIALTADLAPVGGIPRFFGVSPRMGDRKGELSVALEAAAAQASRFLYLEGRLFLYQTTDTKGAMLQHQVEVTYNKKAVSPKKLSVLKSYQDDTGTYVVAALPTATMPPTTWPDGLGVQNGHRPSWVDSTPKIPGYLTAVGVAERRRWIVDSISAADESAIGDLVRQLSLKLQSGTTGRQVEGIGSSSSGALFERAAAKLRDFYVLARWATPSGSTWYSLAIASKSGSSALPLSPLGDDHTN